MRNLHDLTCYTDYFYNSGSHVLPALLSYIPISSEIVYYNITGYMQ